MKKCLFTKSLSTTYNVSVNRVTVITTYLAPALVEEIPISGTIPFKMSSFKNSFSNMLSNIFNFSSAVESISSNSDHHFQNETTTVDSRSNEPPMRFHPVYGKAIALVDKSTIATRDERYFEHSIVFSHRPIEINEVIAVEILETTTDFCGPMRVGFSSINPNSFQAEVVPIGSEFKGKRGVWLKSVHLCPATEGAVIYFKVNSNGSILYGINGKTTDVLLKGVDLTNPLWVVLEVYGSVQTVKFTNKTMDLHLSAQMEGLEDVPNASRNHQGMVTRSRRRNVFNLQLPELKVPSQSIKSPLSAPYYTPGPFDLPGGMGLCIICSEKERNVAFLRCGHVCMCHECAIAYNNTPVPQVPGSSRSRRGKQLCPICRTKIIDILRVYC